MSELQWNIFTRPKSPFYQLRVILPDGKLLTKSTKKSTEMEAKSWAEEYVRELSYREKFGLSAKTKTIDYVYNSLVGKMPTQKRDYYRSAWRNHIESHFGGRDVDTLKTPEIRNFIKGLNLSGSRIAAIGVVLRQIIKHAIEEDWIKEGQAPKVPATTYRSGKRDAFTEEEMRVILKGLKEDMGNGIKQTDKDSRILLYYYVRFLYHTGARPGVEMENLRFMDISESTKGNRKFLRIRIRAETTKVRREREIVSETSLVEIYEELKALQKSWGNDKPTGKIFSDSRGIVRRFSNSIFRRALIRMNMLVSPDGKERSMYMIRHTKISAWVRKGLPLPAIALQSGNSPTIIMSTYNKAVAADFVERFVEE